MTTTPWLLFKQTFPRVPRFSYLNEVRKQLAGCHSCLDIGCGPNSHMRLLGFDRLVGLEGHRPSYEMAVKNHTHHGMVFGRVEEMGALFKDKEFDCCVAMDLIEHLNKEEGLRLIQNMERISRRKILLFTPNGFMPQRSKNGDLQEHHSGWDAGEMKMRGFTVIGTHGHRFFRKEMHEPRFRPQAVSGLVSEITHYAYTRNHPRHAAAILCVKDVTQ